MQIFVIIVLLAALLIFGMASSAQSYASAQQAQAVIEVAQVAQINAFGNVVTLVVIGAVIMVLLAALVLVLVLMYRRPQETRPMPQSRQRVEQIAQPDPTQLLLSALAVRMLEQYQPTQAPQIEAPKEEQPVDQPLHWLR